MRKVTIFGSSKRVNMNKAVMLIVFFSCCLISAVSCKRNHYKINISSIEAGINIQRFEQSIFSSDPAGLPADIPLLKKEYGSFLQLFSFVINAGNVNDTSFANKLVNFVTDRLNYEVYEKVTETFPVMDSYKKDLEEAFRHYLYYFPEMNVPSVITCITGFNNSIITGDSVIGIGLDRYLGTECSYYRRLEIYNYMAANMNPWNIVPDCMYGWGASEWDYGIMNYADDNVLTAIIHEGKLKYFQKCMLPDLNDTILFGFTAGQMKFCRNNERQMWQYLLEYDLLFSTDQFVIRKLTGNAPFTSYFTNESPGRAATWIGFRIVESCMMKNRDMTLGELMNTRDIQDILRKAKYNPE
ncbi:MAG TPA: hypothetical protein DDW27_11045 [Bacteroidales bacterium]|nr:hypothetical protein [Bacteroidales bacterium]